MICPSWLSSSTILLMMSSRFGSFNTPVAFGSTWIVKSFKKEHFLIKVQINHLQLVLCWVEAELPEDVSQKFGLHLTSGRGVKLFERFLESFSFGLPQKYSKTWYWKICLSLRHLSLPDIVLPTRKRESERKENLSVINFAQDDTSCKCKVEGTSGWMGSHVSNWEDIKLSKRQPKGKCQSKCVKMEDTAKCTWKTVSAYSKATQIPTQLMTDVDAAVAN